MKGLIAVIALFIVICTPSVQASINYEKAEADFNNKMDNLSLVIGPAGIDPNTGAIIDSDPYAVVKQLKSEYSSMIQDLKSGNKEAAKAKYESISQSLQSLSDEYYLDFDEGQIQTIMGGSVIKFEIYDEPLGSKAKNLTIDIVQHIPDPNDPSLRGDADSPPMLLLAIIFVIVVIALIIVFVFGRRKRSSMYYSLLVFSFLIIPLASADMKVEFDTAQIVGKTSGTVYTDLLVPANHGSLVDIPAEGRPGEEELLLIVDFTNTGNEIISSGNIFFGSSSDAGLFTNIGCSETGGVSTCIPRRFGGIQLLENDTVHKEYDLGKVHSYVPDRGHYIILQFEVNPGYAVGDVETQAGIPDQRRIYVENNPAVTNQHVDMDCWAPSCSYAGVDVGESIDTDWQLENRVMGIGDLKDVYIYYTVVARGWESTSIPFPAGKVPSPPGNTFYPLGNNPSDTDEYESFISTISPTWPISGISEGIPHHHEIPNFSFPTHGDCWQVYGRYQPYNAAGTPSGVQTFESFKDPKVKGPHAEIYKIVPDKLYLSPIDTTTTFTIGISTHCARDPDDSTPFQSLGDPDTDFPLMLDLYFIKDDTDELGPYTYNLTQLNGGTITESGGSEWRPDLTNPAITHNIVVTQNFPSFQEMIGIETVRGILRYVPGSNWISGDIADSDTILDFQNSAMQDTGPGTRTQRELVFGGDPEEIYKAAFSTRSVTLGVPHLIEILDPDNPNIALRDIKVRVTPGQLFTVDVNLNNPITTGANPRIFDLSTTPFASVLQSPLQEDIPNGDSLSWGSKTVTLDMQAPMDNTPFVRVHTKESTDSAITEYVTINFEYEPGDFDLITQCITCNVVPDEDANIVAYVANYGSPGDAVITVEYNGIPVYAATDTAIPEDDTGALHEILIGSAMIDRGGTVTIKATMSQGTITKYQTVTFLRPAFVDEINPIFVVLLIISVLFLIRRK